MSPSYGASIFQFTMVAVPSPLPICFLPNYRRPSIPIRTKKPLVFVPVSISASARPRKVEHEYYEDEDEERESVIEDSDSMVLLVQLVRNILRKMSMRATKAARRMLPPIFSSDLISFFVNGALMLTVFWVAKALLEVVCSMGSMMFIGLLLVRSMWSILAYLQDQRYDKYDDGLGNPENGRGKGRGYDDSQYRVSPS